MRKIRNTKYKLNMMKINIYFSKQFKFNSYLNIDIGYKIFVN